MNTNSSRSYRYDVFINYNDTDREWVEEWLLPKLDHAKLSFVTQDDYLIGKPKIQIIEEAIKESFFTVIVLSPEWMSSEWNRLVGIVVRSIDPDANQRKLLPIKLKKVDLPEYLNILTQVDMTIQTRWDKGVNQLIININNTLPVAPPWKETHITDFLQWKKWIKRYRRTLLFNTFLLLLVWLTISLIIRIPPFQDKIGWKKLSKADIPQAAILLNTSNYLLAGTYADIPNCDTTQDSGLFKALWVQGQLLKWKKITISELLYKKDNKCILSNIKNFHKLSNGKILAGTHLVKILISDDHGETWSYFSNKNLPSTITSIDSTTTGDIFVIGKEKTNHSLYEFRPKGYWDKIQSYKACKNNDLFFLKSNLNISNLKIIKNNLYISIDEKNEDGTYPDNISGLYKYNKIEDCWNQLISYEERFNLIKLYYNEHINTLHLLFIDQKATPQEAKRYLWTYYIDNNKKTNEWKGDEIITDIYADKNFWYLSSKFGFIFQGEYNSIHKEYNTYLFNQCILNNLLHEYVSKSDFQYCLIKFSKGNKQNTPISLVGSSIYQLSPITWYESILP